MKKNYKLLFTILVLIIISFGVYQYIYFLPRITIDNLELEDQKIDEKNFMYEYGISGDELVTLKQTNSKLKCVIISCVFNNRSFFKKIDEGQIAFENDKELPNIILGTHPDVGFEVLNIKANKTNKRGITILIDPKEYSDEEIIKMLKDVKIVMVQKTKGKIKIESKPVSLEIVAKS